jgi:hypothetical protein
MPAPQADAAAWLEALETCFPGWGGAPRFDWCFRRTVAGRVPDALFLEEDGRLLAGAGVTYRTLELGDGRRLPVAIMTGAWTLPAARGRGAFTRLVAATRETGAGRGAPLFVGFVTEGNVSRRRLAALGALMLPSVYARFRAPSGPSPDVTEIGEPRAAPFLPKPGRARFAYDEEEWRGQFVGRPGVVRAVGAAGSFAALVEEATDLRILALAAAPAAQASAYAALARHAARSARAAFAFATHADALKSLEAGGFSVAARGFVGFLPTAAATIADALGAADEGVARRLLDLDLSDGDRM